MTSTLLLLPRFLWQESVRLRWLIFLWILLASLTTLVASQFWPYQFQASSGLRLEQRNLDILFGDFNAENGSSEPWDFTLDARKDLSAPPGDVDTQLMDREEDRQWLANITPEQWDHILDLTSIDQLDENTLQLLVRTNTRSEARNTSRILVQLLSHRFNAEINQRVASHINYIDSQVKAYEAKLSTAENEMKDFKVSNTGYSDQSNTLTNQHILQLQQNIEKALSDLSDQSVRMRLLDEQLTEGSVAYQNLIGSEEYKTPKAQQLEQQITNLNRRIQSLASVYKETYPELIKAREELSLARQSLATELKTGNSFNANPYVINLRRERASHAAEIESLKNRIAQMRRQLNEETKRVATLSEAGLKLQELQRGYDVNRQLYEKFLAQRENIRITYGALQIIGAATVLPPDPSLNRTVGVNSILILLTGAFVTLLLPVCILIIKVLFDARLRTIDQVWQLGFRVLASAPVYKTSALRLKNVMFLVFLAIALAGISYGYWFQYLHLSR
ncbi:GumC family protein [Gynuella sp.]|uniref:GumC family protein n=1 Tax=Gynuella sp. TaxID=2969146 RepID=UPI003D0E3B42